MSRLRLDRCPTCRCDSRVAPTYDGLPVSSTLNSYSFTHNPLPVVPSRAQFVPHRLGDVHARSVSFGDPDVASAASRGARPIFITHKPHPATASPSLPLRSPFCHSESFYCHCYENRPDNPNPVVPGKPGTHGGAQRWARTTSTTPNRQATPHFHHLVRP